MNFKEKLQAGKFLVTSEIGPPKGIETKHILEDTDYESKNKELRSWRKNSS